MPGGCEYILGRRLLDNPARPHHCDRIGQGPHNRQVMADKQDRQPHFSLQILQQIDDLRFDGNIQGRSRFIRNQHRRAQDQGAGDGDALALAARQLMWIAVAVTAMQPHPFEPVQS